MFVVICYFRNVRHENIYYIVQLILIYKRNAYKFIYFLWKYERLIYIKFCIANANYTYKYIRMIIMSIKKKTPDGSDVLFLCNIFCEGVK